MQEEGVAKKLLAPAAIVLGIIAAVLVAIGIIRMTQTSPGVVKITVETSGGTPYQWSYAISDTSIIEHTGAETKNLDPGADGGEVEEIHSFKALKQGEANIVFEYKSIVDESEDVMETRTYHIVVDGGLNIQAEDISLETVE